ncbi:MAG: efflux RND transporter periplasmic adaptor subunit [Sarcina sp.]
MSKKVKIIIISVIAVVAVGGIGFATMRGSNPKVIMDEMPVDLYTIPGKEKVVMTGKIMPLKSENISIPVGFSEIDKMNVEDGQVIKKGDLIFTCKNTESLNEIATLNATLAGKKKSLEKADEETKPILEEEISQLNTQIANLNKNAYKSVYAPFEGKIYMQESQGENGIKSKNIILETQDYYIKTQTNEMDLVKLAPEQEVDIIVTSTKDKIKGKVTLIGDRPIDGGDTQSGYNPGATSFANFDVKVTPDTQEKLKNGFAVQIIAQYGKPEYKVPYSAVIEEEGKSFVFKIIDDIATKTEITIKEKTDDFVLVEAGLGEEEIIARDCFDQRLIDGQSIYNFDGENASGGMMESGSSTIDKNIGEDVKVAN